MNEKKLTFEEKLDIIKDCPDEEIEFLTPQQKLIAKEIKEDTKIQDIIEMMECSRQNVYSKIGAIADKLSNSKGQERKKTFKKQISRKPTERINFEIYSDLSALTERQREIVTFYMKNPFLSYNEIGKEFGIKGKSVCDTLYMAKVRLSGEWEEKRTKLNEWHRKNYKENAEKIKKQRREYRQNHLDEGRRHNKEYYEKNRDELIKKMREYNKEYYMKNREKILENKKKKR